MVQSGNRITMDESTIYGPMKQMSDFKFVEAYENAVKLSIFLNNTIKSINIGPTVINCYEHSIDDSLQFPVENYLNSDCSVASRKDFVINTVDESMVNEETRTIELKGDDLLYNVFYFKSHKIFEQKTIRLDVPETSFVIINFENTETTYLNTHKIEFANSGLSALNVVYNFLNNKDIVFDFENDFDGTILAPNSNFYAISENETIKNVAIHGQIFVSNIYAKQLKQTCSPFEAIL